MTIKQSQSLLTEILMLLQNLNASVLEFKDELERLKSDVVRVDDRIESFIAENMPPSISQNHVQDHIKLQKVTFLKKIFS